MLLKFLNAVQIVLLFACLPYLIVQAVLAGYLVLAIAMSFGYLWMFTGAICVVFDRLNKYN